jgi:predicted translin family RNA/ssDNA-binding protein
MSDQSNIDAVFKDMNKYFEGESARKETISTEVKKLDAVVGQMLTRFQVIHQQSTDYKETVLHLCKEADNLFEECAHVFSSLNQVVPVESYYKYSYMWQQKSSQLSFLCALKHWLETGELITLDRVQEQLGMTNLTVHIPLEDYLFGLCNLFSELSRLCVNSVTRGDFNTPVRIKDFLIELNGAFRLLNFKNDNLRKRFDGLKYDIKKVEEIVYDLSVRGLIKEETKE